MNQKFLKHNTYTDILTFILSEKDDLINSEIYISIERVRENSTSLEIEFLQELLRVMIHGILHLCGYADKTSDQKKIIRKKEDFYLSQYSFT